MLQYRHKEEEKIHKKINQKEEMKYNDEKLQ